MTWSGVPGPVEWVHYMCHCTVFSFTFSSNFQLSFLTHPSLATVLTPFIIQMLIDINKICTITEWSCISALGHPSDKGAEVLYQKAPEVSNSMIHPQRSIPVISLLIIEDHNSIPSKPFGSLWIFTFHSLGSTLSSESLRITIPPNPPIRKGRKEKSIYF